MPAIVRKGLPQAPINSQRARTGSQRSQSNASDNPFLGGSSQVPSSFVPSDDQLEEYGEVTTPTHKKVLDDYGKLKARPNIHMGKHHRATFKEYCTAFNVNVLQEEDKHRYGISMPNDDTIFCLC